MSIKRSLSGRELEVLTVNEAMRVMLEGLEEDTFKTIDMLSGQMLEECKDIDGWLDIIENMDAIVPGDVKLLDKTGILDKKLNKEASGRLFIKMFLRYMNKNRKKVFVISREEDVLVSTMKRLKTYGSGMKVDGMSFNELTGRSEDEIINEINAMDADCILSVLPSPFQEKFLSEKKAYINGRIWLGCGCIITEENPGTKRKRLLEFLKNL